MDDTKKMLDTIAAAVGMSQMELQGFYDTAKEQGQVDWDQLNWLSNQGVPIFSELSSITGNSVYEVERMCKSHGLIFQGVQDAFFSMSKRGTSDGVRFFVVFYTFVKDNMSFAGNVAVSCPGFMIKRIVSDEISRTSNIHPTKLIINNFVELSEEDFLKWDS